MQEKSEKLLVLALSGGTLRLIPDQDDVAGPDFRDRVWIDP